MIVLRKERDQARTMTDRLCERTLDKPMVGVGKAQEGLHFLPVRWSRRFRYSSYLYWVHLNGILGNNHSEVLHFCLLELTLLGLRMRLCFQSSSITLRVTVRCSSRVSVNIMMSSRYTTTTPSIIKSLKMSSIMVWNVAGLLHSPKNMTNSSKSPRFVQNAAFHSSPSFIWTLLNPHQTSCLVKYLAPLSLFMSLEMRGRGYLFLTVITFRA